MLMIHTLCPARPHWPWTLFMRMESFPIMLLAAHRIAVRRSQQAAGYMNIAENPGPIELPQRQALTGLLRPRFPTAHSHVKACGLVRRKEGQW